MIHVSEVLIMHHVIIDAVSTCGKNGVIFTEATKCQIIWYVRYLSIKRICSYKSYSKSMNFGAKLVFKAMPQDRKPSCVWVSAATIRSADLAAAFVFTRPGVNKKKTPVKAGYSMVIFPFLVGFQSWTRTGMLKYHIFIPVSRGVDTRFPRKEERSEGKGINSWVTASISTHPARSVRTANFTPRRKSLLAGKQVGQQAVPEAFSGPCFRVSRWPQCRRDGAATPRAGGAPEECPGHA